MKKFNLAKIMKTAWNHFRISTGKTFAECLKLAWKFAKAEVKEAEEAARTGLRRMHYAEYKRSYSDCKTVDGSYDKHTKTIEVLTKVSRFASRPAAFGLCPRCHTYCYGDCCAR